MLRIFSHEYVFGAAALAACLALSCSAPAQTSAAKRLQGESEKRRTTGLAGGELVQILHRSARDELGVLHARARIEALDRAIVDWAGTDYPLDGWQKILGKASEVVVWDPHSSPLARTVLDRVRLAVDPAVEVTTMRDAVLTSAASDPTTKWIWVLRFDDPQQVHGDWLAQRATWDEAGAQPPAVTLVDLWEPALGGTVWKADTTVIGDERAAVLAAWAILRARADEAFPDIATHAARFGVDVERFDWWRDAIAAR